MPPPTASLSLLFVAAGLLVIAGASIGRARGHEPQRASSALMAGMTGLGLGFVLHARFVLPLILVPAAVAGIVVADWLRRRDWLLLGSFLIGAGGLWAVMHGWALVNDLTDDAVSYPGWTPIPLAMGAAATIVGAALLLAGREESGQITQQRHSTDSDGDLAQRDLAALAEFLAAAQP